METLEKNGTVYVLVPRDAWQRIASSDVVMPELPPKDKDGNRPAIEAIRVIIARGIIRDRLAVGWTQAELSRRSGVRKEVLNRIEKARVTADESTLLRLDKAIKKQARAAAKPAREKVKLAS